MRADRDWIGWIVDLLHGQIASPFAHGGFLVLRIRIGKGSGVDPSGGMQEQYVVAEIGPEIVQTRQVCLGASADPEGFGECS